MRNYVSIFALAASLGSGCAHRHERTAGRPESTAAANQAHLRAANVAVTNRLITDFGEHSVALSTVAEVPPRRSPAGLFLGQSRKDFRNELKRQLSRARETWPEPGEPANSFRSLEACTGSRQEAGHAVDAAAAIRRQLAASNAPTDCANLRRERTAAANRIIDAHRNEEKEYDRKNEAWDD